MTRANNVALMCDDKNGFHARRKEGIATHFKAPPNYMRTRLLTNDPPSSTMFAPDTCAEAGLVRKSAA
jgi:hypothetical protein